MPHILHTAIARMCCDQQHRRGLADMRAPAAWTYRGTPLSATPTTKRRTAGPKSVS